jgi:hypothetical protein
VVQCSVLWCAERTARAPQQHSALHVSTRAPEHRRTTRPGLKAEVLELEQVVERLAAAVGWRRRRGCRSGFALDRLARSEQRALVGGVFRTHSRTNDLTALERRSWIE